MDSQETPNNNYRFGLSIHPQCRQIISNVYYFMGQENIAGEPLLRLNKIIPRVSAATGISETATTKIINEYNKILKGEIADFSTPRKKSKLETEIEGSDEDKTILRRIILDIFINDRVVPVKIEVVNRFKSTSKFKGLFNDILKSIGFRWKKISMHKHLLIEDHEIRKKRLYYMRSIQNYKKEGYQRIYLGDTYTDLASDDDIKLSNGGKLKDRFSIVAAASNNGFIPNISLIYELTIIDDCTELYSLYTNWFRNEIVNKLPDKSVIVIPESAFQYIQKKETPTEDTTKEQLMQWLEYHEIPFNENDMKSNLLDIVLKRKSEFESHHINEILKNRDIGFVRLPLNHSDLNPMYDIWVTLKERICQNSSSYTVKEIRNICEEFFREFSSEKWKTICEEVEEWEEYYLKSEPIVDEVSDEFIDNPQICLDGISETDATSDEDSGNDC